MYQEWRKERTVGLRIGVVVLLVELATIGRCSPIVLESDHEFSFGTLDYRSLVVDSASGSLYASGKNHLFRLWVYNINDTSEPSLFAHRELPIDRSDRDECERFAGGDQCLNEVRVLLRRVRERSLFVCSSNGLKPQVRQLDTITLADRRPPENVIGVCSSDSTLNTTAVFVEWGNPDDIPSIYSGIRTGLTLENHLIYRPPLMLNSREVHSSMRTMYTDSKWLSEPQFVASFDIGDYVYFFFREMSVEHDSCGRSMYSRVARLCKKDLGGKNVLRQVWTSYVKARLNCSISAAFPFHFDHIQAIHGVEQAATWTFYATMSTTESPFPISAVCVFTLDAINLVFASGNYLEQTSPTSSWLPISPDQLPAHRPGNCIADSRTISDTDLHFAKSHLLMADAVASIGDPLIHVKDEVLTSIVVDTASPTRLVFAITRSSQLYKIAHWGDRSSDSRLLSVYRFPFPDRISTLAILPGESLFAAGESRIAQFHLAMCATYTACVTCATDPYCAWNTLKQACFRRETAHLAAVGWIAPRSADATGECGAKVGTIERLLYPGDGLLLECAGDRVEWRMNGGHTVPRPLRTIDGSLVLLNVSSADAGKYECLSDGAVLVKYEVIVDDAKCTRPTSLRQFQSVYREWCRKYDHYKASLSKWQSLYEQNSQCMSLPKQLKLASSDQFDSNQIENLL